MKTSFHEEPEPGEVWVDPVEIDEVALGMARETITSQLRAAGLPTDTRNIDQHAAELLAARPSLRTAAKRKLEAREKVKATIASEIGISL